MAIGVNKYQLLSSDQTNPILGGLNQGIATILKAQQEKKQRLQMPFVAPKEQASLQGMQLGNQGKALQNKWYEPNMQSQIGLRGAQTTGSLEQAVRQHILNSFLPQSEQARIARENAMSNYYNKGGFGGGRGGVFGGLMRQMTDQVSTDNPNWNPDQVNQAIDAYLRGDTQLADGTQLPVPSEQTLSYADKINLQRNTAQGTNQQRYANTLETAFSRADKNAPGAFKFAGAAGKTKGGVAALKASLGGNNPDYQSYLKFTRQDIPALASEILRTGGASSTDSQKALAIKQLNPISYDSNPQLAQQQWDYLESLYKDISKTISQSPTQTRGNLARGQGGVAPSSEGQIPGDVFGLGL